MRKYAEQHPMMPPPVEGFSQYVPRIKRAGYHNRKLVALTNDNNLAVVACGRHLSDRCDLGS